MFTVICKPCSENTQIRTANRMRKCKVVETQNGLIAWWLVGRREEGVIRLRDYKEDFMSTFVSNRLNQKP